MGDNSQKWNCTFLNNSTIIFKLICPRKQTFPWEDTVTKLARPSKNGIGDQLLYNSTAFVITSKEPTAISDICYFRCSDPAVCNVFSISSLWSHLQQMLPYTRNFLCVYLAKLRSLGTTGHDLNWKTNPRRISQLSQFKIKQVATR